MRCSHLPPPFAPLTPRIHKSALPSGKVQLESQRNSHFTSRAEQSSVVVAFGILFRFGFWAHSCAIIRIKLKVSAARRTAKCTCRKLLSQNEKKKKSLKWNVNFHATSRLRLMRNFRSNLLQILHLIWLICSAIVRWIYLFYSIRNVVIGSGIYVYLFNTDPLLILRWFYISLFTFHVHFNILKCIFLPFLFSLCS